MYSKYLCKKKWHFSYYWKAVKTPPLIQLSWLLFQSRQLSIYSLMVLKLKHVIKFMFHNIRQLGILIVSKTLFADKFKVLGFNYRGKKIIFSTVFQQSSDKTWHPISFPLFFVLISGTNEFRIAFIISMKN